MLRRRPWLGVTCASAHGGQCGVHQQGGRPPHTDHILFNLRRETGGLEPEPVFLNVYGAQELIPRNEFHQPM